MDSVITYKGYTVKLQRIDDYTSITIYDDRKKVSDFSMLNIEFDEESMYYYLDRIIERYEER